MSLMRRSLLALATLGLLATAGCSVEVSSGSDAVDRAEVEDQVAAELADATGQPEPNIDCPDDLEAEVGAELECELTVDGDDTVYAVAVEVTEVDGDRVDFDIEVADEPLDG